MYLPELSLIQPGTKPEALTLRQEYGDDAALYAGGTELLLAMKMGMLQYETLIDLKHSTEFSGIAESGGTLVIGSAATHREIETNPTIQDRIPSLSRMAGVIANVRVRSFGTIGGNLAFAEPHADPPTLLAALGARVTLDSADSTRTVGLEELIVGEYETAITETEILASISIPLPSTNFKSRYLRFKVGERPMVTVAVSTDTDDGEFRGSPTVVIGAVDDKPRFVQTADLTGTPLNSYEAASDLGLAARNTVKPNDDNVASADYKANIIEVLTRRAVLALHANAEEENAKLSS